MVARMQGVSPYKTGGETPPLQIIRFLPKAGAYGMPLTGFGANIRCVHPTDFESCAAGAVSLQAPPQAHAKGSFFQKAPFQSRKNLPATDTGMLGERTQMSAPAFQPHRRWCPPWRSRICAESSNIRLRGVLGTPQEDFGDRKRKKSKETRLYSRVSFLDFVKVAQSSKVSQTFRMPTPPKTYISVCGLHKLCKPQGKFIKISQKPR